MAHTHRLSVLSFSCVLACIAAPVLAQTASTRHIPAAGVGTFTSSDNTVLNTNGPELNPAFAIDADSGNDATGRITINRSIKKSGKVGNVNAPGQQKPKSNPVLQQSIDGLNLYQERIVADGGNQFTVEPPDQGLCVGGGYVLESTNDVVRVFNTNGTAASGVISLNKFYGYPSAILRTAKPPVFGPSVTDPTCIFDPQSQRFFHVILTLDTNPANGGLVGTNHLDLAVSQTSNPLGQWTIYRIPVQNNGTQGTPDHHCAGGFCLGDYPHIGADSNGVYLTTNEFELFGSNFIGAQIYAIPKAQLVAGTGIDLFQYNTGDASTPTASGLPGFTVWPAQYASSAPSEFGGTEYFLSSLAVFQDSGVDNRLQLWSLTDTSALNSGKAPTLVSSLVNTEGYGIPGNARQPGTNTNGVGKAPGGGNVDYPYGQLHGAPVGELAGNDSRMQQVYYANGKLWASLGTGISFGGSSSSDGLAYFILHPKASGGTPTASVDQQGYVADPNVDFTYGTVAATQSGRGIISFTTTGPNNYPSLGYASLDDKIGAGAPRIATAGIGAQDGFTEYNGRPRWGDYGAAEVDGNSIWFAQEYIGQTCTVAQYLADPTCSATRAPLGNWGTRIAQVTP